MAERVWGCLAAIAKPVRLLRQWRWGLTMMAGEDRRGGVAAAAADGVWWRRLLPSSVCNDLFR